ncbi:class I SAM-dependent methyltransferase [Rasiella sp. SM2506]|uniref:class I SAM-dependent methyltransferase n=1 Tax=Rasiella sp. SM2506 TaxID=3423914 RepID=UPI003D7A3CFB
MNILDKFHHWRRRRRWNKQYRSGRWQNLKSDLEASRYFKIKEDLLAFAPKKPNILDIGCGDGVLNERLGDFPFSYFLGVDFSSESIKQAQDKNLPNSEFEHCDVLHFVPKRTFDAIIFNESFYYIPDTEKSRVLQHLLDNLSEDGVLIVSIFRDGPGCWEFFKENKNLKEVDFETIKTSKEMTYWKIGAYTKVSE